jgi:hypothetical protein
MSQESQGQEDDYKVYSEERKALVQASAEETHKFDRTILTLAAGAFGLSLAFIKDIVPDIKPGTLTWLIIGWIAFILTLISTLISFLTSQSACRRQIEILEKTIFDKCEREKEKNIPAVWTGRLNIFSIITFMTGVIFLALFVIFNLSQAGG